MSGRKVSEFRLSQETERRIRLEQEVLELGGAARALAGRVRGVLDRTPPGLRETFAEDVAAAEAWCGGVPSHAGAAETRSTDPEVLSRIAESRRLELESGSRVLASLENAFGGRADSLTSEAAADLTAAESALGRHRRVLDLWHPAAVSAGFEDRVRGSREQLGRRHLAGLHHRLEELQAAIVQAGEVASRNEERHQKRLEVLKSLRQVCADLGFQEIGAPVRPPGAGRGDPIVIAFDTLDRGTIKFVLALDKVSTDSQIAAGRCLEETDRISELLQERFSIKTSFQPECVGDDRVRRHAGECDLPESPAPSIGHHA